MKIYDTKRNEEDIADATPQRFIYTPRRVQRFSPGRHRQIGEIGEGPEPFLYRYRWMEKSCRVRWVACES